MLSLHGKSRTGSKNIWDNDTAELPRPALFNIQALLHADGEVWLTNGEKTTMAMMTAGIFNVVNTFGEGNQVAEAITVLKEHGIWTVHLVPDCDEHGIRAAYKWRQLGQAAGLDIRIHDLAAYALIHFGMSPDDISGWDLRDLWLHLKQDHTAFHQALANLPELEFDHYAAVLPQQDSVDSPRRKTRHKPTWTVSGGIDWAQAFERWKTEEILPALEQVSPSNKSIHHHRHCPNPRHHDHHPSFRITPESAPVCTCGKITWTLLAEWVGAISWAEYKKLVIAQLIKSDETLYHFPHGIPNDLRHTLLTLNRMGRFKDQAPALIVLELRNEAILDGVIGSHEALTVDQLADYAQRRDTTLYTMREGLRQAEALGFFTRTDVPDGRGRPVGYYQPQPIRTVLATLQQKIAYRIREKLFGEHTPDTITADFFSDLPEAEAQRRADAENQRRSELYHRYAEQRAWLDAEYSVEVDQLERNLAYDKLIVGPSLWLDPDDQWTNGGAYRRSLNKAYANYRIDLHQSTTQYQRAALIGVSAKTLTNYQQQSGIVLEPQYIETSIQQPQFLATLDHLAPWAQGRNYGRLLESSTGERRTVTLDNLDYLEGWVHLQLESGHTVSVKVQTGSLERWGSVDEQQELQTRLANKRQREAASAIAQRAMLPFEVCFPPTFTADYIEKQLAMTPPDDLFRNLPASSFVIENKVGKFQNKYPDDVDLYSQDVGHHGDEVIQPPPD